MIYWKKTSERWDLGKYIHLWQFLNYRADITMKKVKIVSLQKLFRVAPLFSDLRF